jgi:hypothetical protein
MRIIPETELPGWMSDNDLNFLMPIAQGKDCAELGVWKGRTSFHLLQVCKSMVMVDPWEGLETYPNPDFTNDGNIFGEFCKNFSKFYDHRGKQLEIYKKPAALVAREMHPDRQFDLVFIDGNHNYDYVLEDIGLWVKRLRPGGWLCGHDYHVTQQECIKAVQDAIPQLDHIPIGDPDGVWGVQIQSKKHALEIYNRVFKALPTLHERTAWVQQV